MLSRTSAKEVKEILDTSLSNTIIGSFIRTANIIVTDILGSDTTLSATQKEEIERWLTAHLIGITKERATTKEKLGEAAVEYAGTFGKGLEQTSWGQMVLQLDTCGQFANLGKKDINITAITSFE